MDFKEYLISKGFQKNRHIYEKEQGIYLIQIILDCADPVPNEMFFFAVSKKDMKKSKHIYQDNITGYFLKKYFFDKMYKILAFCSY